jgi:uncharacterized protein YjiS (DUF1127 family)
VAHLERENAMTTTQTMPNIGPSYSSLKEIWVTFEPVFVHVWDLAAKYHRRTMAVEHLQDFDKHLLSDVGLLRSEITIAVDGDHETKKRRLSK